MSDLVSDLFGGAMKSRYKQQANNEEWVSEGGENKARDNVGLWCCRYGPLGATRV
jgi:hypothetical protein